MNGVFSVNFHPFSVLYESMRSCGQSADQTHNVAIANFRQNQLFHFVRSSFIAGVTYLSGGFALEAVAIRGFCFKSAIAAVTFLFLDVVWHKWANAPYLLAHEAFRALSSNEGKALEIIQKGADIHLDFAYHPTGFPFLSVNTIIVGRRGNSYSLLQEAVRLNRLSAIALLAQFGADLNQSSSILGHASKLETVKTLVANGSNVSLHNNRQFSPLSIQIFNLDDSFLERLEIISYLLDRGAKLQPGARFNEKAVCIQKIQEKIQRFSLRVEEHSEVLSKLRKILENLNGR